MNQSASTNQNEPGDFQSITPFFFYLFVFFRNVQSPQLNNNKKIDYEFCSVRGILLTV